MTTSLVLYCILYYLTAGVAIVIGYHRCLSHRSLKLKKWFERLVITAGLPAGTPIQWAGNHRYHHAHTDEETDPHSPVISGFWYAHNGWYINSKNPLVCFLYALAGPFRFIIDSWNRPMTNQQYNYLAQDVSSDPYYNFISRPLPYMIAMWLHLIIAFGTAYYFWGLTGLLSLWFTLLLIFNFGDAIDSITHMYGEQPYKKKDHARNNWFIAIMTLGDGWHADHHQFPGSAKLGFAKGRLDISWQIILFLKFLGIAYDTNVTTPETVIRQLKNNTIDESN
jgi:fatty-acid desaturase